MISHRSTAHAHRPARHLVRHGLLVIGLLCSISSAQLRAPASTTRMAGTLYPCGGICSQTTVTGAQTAV